VARLRAAYGAGARAPLLVLPTGGGKTLIFSHICAGAAARRRRIALEPAELIPTPPASRRRRDGTAAAPEGAR
jgi:superfamily II DNA or RNA helicase